MNETVETVLIDTKNGPVLINKSDYEADKASFKLAKGGAVEPVAAVAPVEPVAAVAPAQLLVMKTGRKFFITDVMGVRVSGEQAEALGIDTTGYDTEQAAKDALPAAQ